MTRVVDGRRGFTVRAAYDAQNLYVRYDVQSPFELVNSIPDPRIVFTGGNLLDIQLATDPMADPQRTRPAPGDVRLLVTRQQDKPVAVVYRPKVRGVTGLPVVLKSPTGQEAFDASAACDQVRLDYRKMPAGFRALGTIPLAVLGWAPQPGSAVRLDVGYLFGNELGHGHGRISPASQERAVHPAGRAGPAPAQWARTGWRYMMEARAVIALHAAVQLRPLGSETGDA